MAKFRAKVKVDSVTDDGYADTIKCSPVCGGTPEDNSYSKATPSGSIELRISNDQLRGQIKPGAVFYVDFTPA